MNRHERPGFAQPLLQHLCHDHADLWPIPPLVYVKVTHLGFLDSVVDPHHRERCREWLMLTAAQLLLVADQPVPPDLVPGHLTPRRLLMRELET